MRYHMDKLQNRRFKELAEESLELEMEDLQAEIEIIRGLDPRPGSKYGGERSNYVVPDVYVVKIDEDYQIILNEDGLPRLADQSGLPPHGRPRRRTVKHRRRSQGVRAQQAPLAFRLIKSLEERQRTIYKVAASIVKFQRAFLDHGIQQLRPLVLARRGRRHRHARIDGQPRGQQQVHAHAPRPVRDALLFSQRHPFDPRAARTCRR